MKVGNFLDISGLSDSVPSDRIENTMASPAADTRESSYSPSTVTVTRRRWAVVRCSYSNSEALVW